MTDIIQGSEEWHQLRLGKITASRIADVLATIKTGEAASRADYRMQLVCERLNGKHEESYTNQYMANGIELEPNARAWYEVERNIFVTQVPFIQHPILSFAGASPDGVVEDEDELGLIEIKCPKATTHAKTMLEDRVPTKYIPQMQWQMACSGAKWCDFVSYCPEFPLDLQLFVKRVMRDDEYIKEVEGKVIEFNDEVETTIQRLKGNKNGS